MLEDTTGKLEAKQVGMLQREIGAVQNTNALILLLGKMLSTINAMDDLIMMKKSKGEATEIAAKIAAGDKDAKKTDAALNTMKATTATPDAKQGRVTTPRCSWRSTSS